MKIGHPAADKPVVTLVTPAGAATAGAAAAQAAGPALAGGPDASAKIALSATASTLLTERAAPEFDAGKVARIAKAIEDGSFRIDPGAIADRLIANAHEVMTKFKP